MAILSTYSLKDTSLTIKDAYTRVSYIILNAKNSCVINVLIYASTEDRAQGKQHVDSVSYEIYCINDSQKFEEFFSNSALTKRSIFESAYEFLKTLPEYENGKDA